MSKKDYDIEYQKNNVIRKIVTFNRNNADDMKLLKVVEKTGNANAWIKELIRKEVKTMNEYFNMDSFGSECPSNWEAICEYLNRKTEEVSGDEEEVREAIDQIWENFSAGDYDDDPEFPGYDKTYAEYMAEHPEENMSWCRPYVSDDGRYAVAVNDGEIIEAVTPKGHMPEGHLSPLTDEEIEELAREIDHDYNLYDGWNDTEIILDKLHETGCASCPFFSRCDAMTQTME